MKKIAFMFAVAAMFVACGLLLTALPLIQLLLLSNLAN